MPTPLRLVRVNSGLDNLPDTYRVHQDTTIKIEFAPGKRYFCRLPEYRRRTLPLPLIVDAIRTVTPAGVELVAHILPDVPVCYIKIPFTQIDIQTLNPTSIPEPLARLVFWPLDNEGSAPSPYDATAGRLERTGREAKLHLRLQATSESLSDSPIWTAVHVSHRIAIGDDLRLFSENGRRHLGSATFNGFHAFEQHTATLYAKCSPPYGSRQTPFILITVPEHQITMGPQLRARFRRARSVLPDTLPPGHLEA